MSTAHSWDDTRPALAAAPILQESYVGSLFRASYNHNQTLGNCFRVGGDSSQAMHVEGDVKATISPLLNC